MVSKKPETRKEAVYEHFKNRTAEWESFYQDNHSTNHFVQRMNAVLRQLEKYCPANNNRIVLDVGCGNGAYLFKMSQLPGEGIGVDIVNEMVELTKVKINGNEKWKALQGSATQLQFKDSHFGAITSAGLVEYFDNPAAVLREFERVLKPNAVAIITFPNKYSWRRLGRLPFSLGSYLKISTKIKLATLLHKIKGKTLNSSDLSLNEVYGPMRIKRIAHQANLRVEEITSVGLASLPLLGFRMLSSKWESSLSCWIRKRKMKFPWHFLGDDLVVVFRKNTDDNS